MTEDGAVEFCAIVSSVIRTAVYWLKLIALGCPFLLITYCMCCSVLSRVLEPTVMMEMSLSDGTVHNFEVLLLCCIDNKMRVFYVLLYVLKTLNLQLLLWTTRRAGDMLGQQFFNRPSPQPTHSLLNLWLYYMGAMSSINY